MPYFRSKSVPVIDNAIHPWKLIPSSYSNGGSQQAVVIVYYGEIQGKTLDEEVTGVDGKKMSKDDPRAFFIDPCKASGDGSSGTVSKIYLEYHFEGLRRKISKRDIGWTENADDPMPVNTEDKKYQIIGEVKLSVTTNSTGSRQTSYSIVSQNISENIFTEPVEYIAETETIDGDENNAKIGDIYFADDNLIQIYKKPYDEGPKMTRISPDGVRIGAWLEEGADEGAIGVDEIGKDANQLYSVVESGGTTYIYGRAPTEGGVSKTKYESFEISADGQQEFSRFSLEDSEGQAFIARTDTKEKTSRIFVLAGKSEEGESEQICTIYTDSENGVSHVTAYDNENNFIEMGTEKFGAPGGLMPIAFLNGRVNAGEMSFALVAGDVEGGYASLELKNGVDTSSKLGVEDLTINRGEKNVYIPVPQVNGDFASATWKEVTVCIDGETKKMMVLGTDPY